MKNVFFLIAMSAGLFACSGSATDENKEGAAEKLEEVERLGNERSDFYDKQIEALGEGDMATANKHKASMDSVDALYNEALVK